MSLRNLTDGRRRGLLAFVHRYPLAHVLIGLAGNLLFVIGSLLYVMDLSHLGRYLFLAGSSAMFLGALGEVVKILGRRILRRHDVDPSTGEAPAGGAGGSRTRAGAGAR